MTGDFIKRERDYRDVWTHRERRQSEKTLSTRQGEASGKIRPAHALISASQLPELGED